MKVSIIVPERETESVKSLLSFIEKFNTYKNIEVVVIDEGLERSAQRNSGIKRATGDYLLFLDSDMLIHPKLIQECVDLMRWFSYDGLYIPEIITTKGWFGRLRNWERSFYTGTPIDTVRFVRKGCPLFDETMNGPEDSDWDRKIGNDRAVSLKPYYHQDNIGIKEYFRKKAYYSKSMKRFKELHPNDKVLNFWWRCFGVFLEQGKWKRFLSRPHLAVMVLLLIFVRGVIYETTLST